MRTLVSLAWVIPPLAVLAAGCGTSKASINTYADPSADFTTIQSISVFPMRNTSFAPAEARVMNRRITQVIAQRNPTVEILGPAEANDRLNDHGLADDYAAFLVNYVSSGIPDRGMLGQFGAALGTDAIMQAEIVQVVQEDAQAGYGGHKGYTRVTVRFSMLDCRNGRVLWEASSDGRRATAGNWGDAPPIIEAVELAVDKILDNMPRFGPVGTLNRP